jgi:hypothetical protein
VCTLIEQGEHGALAAQVSSKVIKAYVDKQRRAGRKFAEAPAKGTQVAGVWSRPSEDGQPDGLQGGHFTIASDGRPKKPARGAGD